MIAASAIYLSRRILLSQDAEWPLQLAESSGLSEGELRFCSKDMCILLQGIEKCTLQAVRKKFMLPKYREVALIKIDAAAKN
jgi:hypothetical protein